MSNTPFLASFIPLEDKMAKACWQRFMELGLPTRLDYMSLKGLEEVQYVPSESSSTPFSLKEQHRIVFVNGYLRKDLSILPKGCDLLSQSQAFKTYGTLLNNHYNKFVLTDGDPFVLLNGACCPEGAFLYVQPKTICKEPISIISFIDAKQESAWVMPRLFAFMGASCELELVARTECVDGKNSFYNAVFDFQLEDGAHLTLTHADLAGTSSHSYRFDAFRAHLKRNSTFKAVQLTDSEKSRRDWKIILDGEGAEADVSGLWFLDGKKETHTNVAIEHREPHTRSNQLFKGVLDDEALSSFQGAIVVRKKAQKTQAYQLNNNLILSSKAQANSKPNLEIFADDVKASHGATVGQLDQELAFYLKTRGLPESLARGLLIRGFCEEVINKAKSAPIRTQAEEYLATHYNITVS